MPRRNPAQAPLQRRAGAGLAGGVVLAPSGRTGRCRVWIPGLECRPSRQKQLHDGLIDPVAADWRAKSEGG